MNPSDETLIRQLQGHQWGVLKFNELIPLLTGFSVLPVDMNEEQMSEKITKLKEGFDYTKEIVNETGIAASSMNRLGMKMRDVVIQGLNKVNGIQARVSQTQSGSSSGYPRIQVKINDDSPPFYLTPKTTNIESSGSPRDFYLSISEEYKVNANGFHLIVWIYVLKKEGLYFIDHWELFDIQNITIGMKSEFNSTRAKIQKEAIEL